MRYWIGLLGFATAASLLASALRHRRRVLALAPRAAIERQRAAALADPRSIASMGEIGRSLVLWFVAYAGLKTGLLWFAFDAHRYLSYLDLAGFYAALAAYAASLQIQTRWRLADARAAAQAAATDGSRESDAGTRNGEDGVTRGPDASPERAAHALPCGTPRALAGGAIGGGRARPASA